MEATGSAACTASLRFRKFFSGYRPCRRLQSGIPDGLPSGLRWRFASYPEPRNRRIHRLLAVCAQLPVQPGADRAGDRRFFSLFSSLSTSVGFCRFFELLLRFFIARIGVGWYFFRQFSICFLQSRGSAVLSTPSTSLIISFISHVATSSIIIGSKIRITLKIILHKIATGFGRYQHLCCYSFNQYNICSLRCQAGGTIFFCKEIFLLADDKDFCVSLGQMGGVMLHFFWK